MEQRKDIRKLLILSFAAALTTGIISAQENANQFRVLRWRSLGPDRGGRVTAVAGLVNDRMKYYMGATGGGVWKTVDAGITWMPISDRYFKTGSVGAIAVSESNPSIVYVGMGEACLRSNISSGDGVYKSTDAGKSWRNVGLRDTKQIGNIYVDPQNPDLVYVTAIGHPYGPNEERGVFRSRDGGTTWKKVLFVDDKTGAADIAADPRDPKTMYASTWQVLRFPWDIAEVGPGSGIYKTIDGGDSWTRLTEGLPKTDMGKIGLAVSSVDPNRVWATIGGDDGGIYRSDNAGKSWRLLNGSFEMHSRQYYYGHIFADPKHLDTVYTFSSKSFYKSTDGGTTWTTIRTPHGDYHDLWIDPNDDLRMVNGNDGGATVTFDGGKSWSSEENQPTGQFYTVRADNAFPYNVLGAQQDDTTVAISSAGSGGFFGTAPRYDNVGGGESGYVLPDLRNPNIVYAGAYWGLLTRFDRRTDISRNITVWPDYPGGRTGSQQKYRFQWTFPIAQSAAEPDAVYVGGNVVFKSLDQGQSWQVISPDLTRNDKTREAGGRLEDVYCTVFTIAPSSLDKNLVWAGSDDGLIHVTRDGGKTWTNVTPPDIQPWTRINIIEASSHDPGTAYAAVNRYQMDDYRPFLYRTHDFGKHWTLAVDGIPQDTFVRTVREDPSQPGLVFAGTESGVYVSFDKGDHWQSLQLNLPIVPVTDLTIKDGDLVGSTQGRAFWILDDISPLEQLDLGNKVDSNRLFAPRPAYRVAGGGRGRRNGVGNGGLVIDYRLASNQAGPVTIEISDSSGKFINSFSSESKPGSRGESAVTSRPGLNRFVWDLRYADAHGIGERTYFLGGSLRGPEVAPGRYKVKLTMGHEALAQFFEVKKDPRVTTTLADYQKQLTLLLNARDKLSSADDAIREILDLQQQLEPISSATQYPEISAAAAKADAELKVILHALYEPRFTGYDDQTLIYPLQLNNRLAAMQNYLSGDFAPTEQAEQVLAVLSKDLQGQLSKLENIVKVVLPPLNDRLKSAGLQPVKATTKPSPRNTDVD